MGNRNHPLILKDDFDLFIRIAKHGFVDFDYIYRFAYKGRQKSTIDARIKQLTLYQFLIMERTFIPPGYTVSYRTGYRLVTLGKRGLEAVRENGIEANDWTHAVINGSPYRMYHQAQIAMVCDHLRDVYANSEETNWEMIDVLNEKEAYLEEEMNRPDALMIFQPKGKEDSPLVYIFLEIERSYASEASLKRKIRGYQIAIEERLYLQKFRSKVADQRVLFVAQTDSQKNALLKKLRKIDIGNTHILIAGYQETMKDPLEHIYEIASAEEKIKLLGKME